MQLTAAAAAELGRQAAVAGTPGLMHLDLVEGTCEQWVIRLRPGHLAGTPVARADGLTCMRRPTRSVSWPASASITAAISVVEGS